MKTPLRTLGTCFLGAAAVVLFQAPSAFAASGTTITIEQSTPSLLGSWVLTKPDGKSITGNASTKTIPEAAAGTYTLTVDPPEGAVTSITLYKQDGTKQSVTAAKATFILLKETTSLRIVINYDYDGKISVGSNPRNATFELKGEPGVRLTGSTPASFDELPPLNYTVFFGEMEGCIPPKPQGRPLEENGELSFFGTYDCTGPTSGTDKPTPAPKPTSGPSSAPSVPEQHVSIWQAAQKAEILPGGKVMVTIGIRNAGSASVKNLTLSEAFDTKKASVASPVPKGGKVSGSAVQWMIPELTAGQSWIVDFTLETKTEAKAGDQLTLVASLTGMPDAREATITIGIAALPKTGAAFDALFLMLAGAAALPLTSLIRRRTIRSIETA